MKVRGHVHAGSVLVVLCFGAVASGHAPAATTVYKCFDKNLGVLYTDEPCRGEQLSIRAGEADPAAVAALQRERDAVSQSAAQRIIDNRRATLQREFAPQYAYPLPEALPAYADAEPYYTGGYGGYGYVPYSTDKRPHPPRAKPARRFDGERAVPNPPPGLHRR